MNVTKPELALRTELATGLTIAKGVAVEVASGTVEGRTVFGVGDAPTVYSAIEAGVGIAANSATTEAGKAFPATRGCC